MQSRVYIVLGIVVSVAVMATCAFVVETLSHQVINIAQDGYLTYVDKQQFRYGYFQWRSVCRLRP